MSQNFDTGVDWDSIFIRPGDLVEITRLSGETVLCEVTDWRPGGPAGGGWHYPSETLYEDQSHITRGEN